MSDTAFTILGAGLADRYRLERELGAGGMATVYLAEDVRHHRKVALKLLHPELSAVLGPDRFLKEIELTASLQHPHILPLFDSGSVGGQLYYVMPFVQGETLRTRLERERQLPIAEAVRLASEIADALQYAHGRGIIHRDIKPENILLQGGHALVADFGIALAVQSAGGQRMTQTGLSLGTPHYMSPEQAMGDKTVDARTDVYALGAMTYEMLAGDPPFTGSSAQAIVAKVLTERPAPLHTLRDTVPPDVEKAVLTALAKLPADRFSTVAEFSAALANAGSSGTANVLTLAVRPTGRPTLSTKLLLGALVATAGLALWGWLRPSRSSEPVTRVAVALPSGQELLPDFFGFGIDLSPDGTRLAYVGPGPTDRSKQIWVRPLDALEATAVRGTIGANTVRWSPDGRALYITIRATNGTGGSVLSLDGSNVVRLPESHDGEWAGGRIYSARPGAIMRQEVGGSPERMAPLDTAYAVQSMTVLPDESAAIVGRMRRGDAATATAEIVAVSLKTGAVTPIASGVYARYLGSGHLLHVTSTGEVFVAPFDARALRLTGANIPVARVAMGTNQARSYPQITASNNGTLAYLAGDPLRQRLVVLDPRGRVERRLDVEGSIWGVTMSPDGSRIAFALREDNRDPGSRTRGRGDVWVQDLGTGARTRLTSEFLNVRPSWSRDGRYVLFARLGGPENQALYERRADASEPERLVVSQRIVGHSVGEGAWLPDHRTLILRTYEDGPDASRNIYSMTAGIDSVLHPLAVTSGEETNPVPSPDGTLVAYVSDETGTKELYLQPFPGGGGRLVVTRGGGSGGRWSRDGRELYFWDQRGKLMAASIQSRPTLAVTGVREVGGDFVLANAGGQSDGLYDVGPDGRIIAAEQVSGSFQLILVRNWMAGLGAERRQ